MKTLKQIADELGIDKQKVYRYIKKHHINDAHHDAGVMYFDEAVENAIKSHFFNNDASSDAHHEAHQTASNEVVNDAVLMQLIDAYKDLISTLKDQLAKKDEQIKDLKQLLDQEQQLHHRTQNTLLALENKEASEPSEEYERTWFGLYKKVKNENTNQK